METNAQIKLPNAPSAIKALVFGIISLATMCAPIIPLIFGILGFNFGKKTIIECESNPGMYGGIGMGKAGKIMGLIGLIIGAVGIVFWIIYIIFIVAYVSASSDLFYFG